MKKARGPHFPTARVEDLWARYFASPSRDLLRVYADVLVEDGDPRGPFLQLSLLDDPTPAQVSARATLMKKLTKSVLAGPGGEALREMTIGADGLLARARVEAARLVEYVDEITRMNPRLVLTVTSIGSLRQARELGATSLGDVYLVDFNAMSGGGLSLDDRQLAALAPALANVRHLTLCCRGGKHFTPDGLRALGRHLKRIRYLGFDYYNIPYEPGSNVPPEAPAYAAVIATEPGFATLRGLDLDGITAADVPALDLVVPGLVGPGGLTVEARIALEGGVEIADQLDAALAS